MKIKELLKNAEYGITVYFVFADIIEMEYYFDKNSSLSEADMEVLNMEPSKIWGWDDGTICVEVKINGQVLGHIEDQVKGGNVIALSMIITKKDEHAHGLNNIAFIDFDDRSEKMVKELFELPQVIEAGYKLDVYIGNKGF